MVPPLGVPRKGPPGEVPQWNYHSGVDPGGVPFWGSPIVSPLLVPRVVVTRECSPWVLPQCISPN